MADRPDTFEELMELPEAVQSIVFQRRQALCIWDAALSLGKARGMHEPAVTRQVMPMLRALGLPKVSRSTLFVWRRAYRSDGLAGLSDLRRVDRDRWKLFGPFFAELEKTYSAMLMRIDVAHRIVADCAAIYRWQVPPLRDSQKFIRRYVLPGLTTERGGKFEGGLDRASNDI